MILGFTPFECLCNILFYSEFCFFLNSVLTPRFKKRWMFVSYFCLVVFVLLASVFFERMSIMRVLTLPVILMIYNLLFFTDKRLRCVFAAWLIPVVIFLSEIIVVALVYNEEMLAARLHTAPIRDQILCWGIEFVSAGLLYWLIAVCLNRVRNKLDVREMLMFVFFPVSQFLLLYGWMNATRLSGAENHQLHVLGVMILCLLADFGLFASIFRVSHQSELEKENQLLARQIDVQRSHYAGLTVQYESIRRMRHDIAKHVTAMNTMLASGRNEEAAAYVQELHSQPYDNSLGICEHPVVDAYLYSAVQKGKEMGITLDAVVSVPADISIASTDLVCTYGNLLDNAFEACYRLQDSVIKVRTGIAAGYLVISTENPLGPENERKSRIRGLERGIGMRVLNDLAHKYNGSFRYTSEDGIFRSEITYQLKG